MPSRTSISRPSFGEMLYVVGPSGSGKTTMLSMISGILRPNSGIVKIEDTEIWGLTNDALAEFRLHKIGFVFQDYHLFPAPHHRGERRDPAHPAKARLERSAQGGGARSRDRRLEEARAACRR